MLSSKTWQFQSFQLWSSICLVSPWLVQTSVVLVDQTQQLSFAQDGIRLELSSLFQGTTATANHPRNHGVLTHRSLMLKLIQLICPSWKELSKENIISLDTTIHKCRSYLSEITPSIPFISLSSLSSQRTQAPTRTFRIMWWLERPSRLLLMRWTSLKRKQNSTSLLEHGAAYLSLLEIASLPRSARPGLSLQLWMILLFISERDS